MTFPFTDNIPVAVAEEEQRIDAYLATPEGRSKVETEAARLTAYLNNGANVSRLAELAAIDPRGITDLAERREVVRRSRMARAVLQSLGSS